MSASGTCPVRRALLSYPRPVYPRRDGIARVITPTPPPAPHRPLSRGRVLLRGVPDGVARVPRRRPAGQVVRRNIRLPIACLWLRDRRAMPKCLLLLEDRRARRGRTAGVRGRTARLLRPGSAPATTSDAGASTLGSRAGSEQVQRTDAHLGRRGRHVAAATCPRRPCPERQSRTGMRHSRRGGHRPLFPAGPAASRRLRRARTDVLTTRLAS